VSDSRLEERDRRLEHRLTPYDCRPTTADRGLPTDDRRLTPIRVAIVDSGIHAAHPHVGGVVSGVALHPDGARDDDFVDHLGHGTAVAAAIREKAPDVDLIAVKVFWRSLSTTVPTLVRAIDEACERDASLINLSLGTREAGGRAQLEAAVLRAGRRGTLVISAAGEDGRTWLPGALPGVIPVRLDWSCPRETFRVVRDGGRAMIAASGYPRDIPGVPRERNLKGASFAVANATGFVARARAATGCATPDELFAALAGAGSVL
jgi:subtilisin family serine protease